MSPSNKAIYIGPENNLYVTSQPIYEPGENQALIQIYYSSVNPADIKHGLEFGMNNHVSGYEFCGQVIKVGPNFPYALGDDIYGSKRMDAGSEFGAHQAYLLAEGNSMIAKRPDTIPPADAAALSLAVRTAADALFNAMPNSIEPLVLGAKASPKPIVIWGGASAVGSAAIQLARAIGLSPIITTASARNHEALKSLGATHCFDYSDDKVVSRVQAVLDAQDELLKYIFDSVCSNGSWKQCEALNSHPDAYHICTLPVKSDKKKWHWCLATKAWDVVLPPPADVTRADAEQESRLVQVVEWAAANYRSAYRVHNLTEVSKSSEAIQAIYASGEGKIKFKKVVIKHPLED